MSIKIHQLEHVYNPNTPFSHAALKGINLEIPEGKVTAIIGQTGSGKSTLVQHLNGLLIPTAGTLDICGYHIQPLLKIKDVKQLRKEVGLVFQFPEYQLFEETIEKDIAFGPKNFGVEETEASQLVRNILPVVGLDESYLDRSPFELSGGQKRRVAIAGILVLDPKVLVLDEPTAGVDPRERIRIRSIISEISQDRIVLLATHVVTDVECIANQVLLMKKGKLVLSGSPEELIVSMKGKVKEKLCTPEEIAVYQKQYGFGSLLQRQDGQVLRLVGDRLPENFTPVSDVGLEEVYLYYCTGKKKR